MYCYQTLLSPWITLLVLLCCGLHMVNMFTVISCGHELNSAGGKDNKIHYSFINNYHSTN